MDKDSEAYKESHPAEWRQHKDAQAALWEDAFTAVREGEDNEPEGRPDDESSDDEDSDGSGHFSHKQQRAMASGATLKRRQKRDKELAKQKRERKAARDARRAAKKVAENGSNMSMYEVRDGADLERLQSVVGGGVDGETDAMKEVRRRRRPLGKRIKEEAEAYKSGRGQSYAEMGVKMVGGAREISFRPQDRNSKHNSSSQPRGKRRKKRGVGSLQLGKKQRR